MEINGVMLSLMKWLVIIPFLLLVPYSGFVVIGLAILFFFLRKVNEFDLLLLLVLTSIVGNSLSGMGDYAIFRFILIPVILLRYGLSSIKKIVFESRYHLLLILYLFINVIFISSDSLYSAYKLPIFLLLIIAAYTGANISLTKGLTLINLEGFFLAIVISSFLVIPFESISYARNGVGFQGVLAHPNTFAVFLVPYACLLFYRVLRKIALFDVALLIVVISYLFMSQSRTAILSIILATIVMLIVNSNFRLYFGKRLLLFFIPLTLVFIVYYSEILVLFNDLLLKGGNADSFVESVKLSRFGLFSEQMLNVEKNTFFGIGFMIPSNLDSQLFFTSADNGNTYEKGNMIMAVIEELGIIGFFIFLMFFFKVIFGTKNKIKHRPEYLFMSIAALITTMGEMTLFSIGGSGLFIWMLIFLNYRHNNRNT
jgi:hypothetical protein